MIILLDFWSWTDDASAPSTTQYTGVSFPGVHTIPAGSLSATLHTGVSKKAEQ